MGKKSADVRKGVVKKKKGEVGFSCFFTCSGYRSRRELVRVSEGERGRRWESRDEVCSVAVASKERLLLQEMGS